MLSSIFNKAFFPGILFLLMYHSSLGQCPNSITVSTQEDLEILMAQYPDCEELNGSISISGTVSDLSPLAQITSVGGFLHIQDNTGLTSLNGLQNITSVGQNMYLMNNPNIISLGGLSSLTHIGGELRIWNFGSLTDLQGLESLTSVKTIYISGNPILGLINNLNALTNVDEDLIIGDNPLLTDIQGFNSLEEIGRDLYISNNEMLQTVTGTDQLRSARSIFINSHLKSIAFTSLETVEQDFRISTTGLEEITGCDHLVSVGGSLILNVSVPDLPDFPMLEMIGGALRVDMGPYLKVIDGFSSLQSIGMDASGNGFEILFDSSLQRITAFQNLESIDGDFNIQNNDSLFSIEGFQNLVHVGNDFSLRFNPMLTDCKPVCNLLQNGSIGGLIRIQNNGPTENGPCWTQENVLTSCTFSVNILDGNSKFYPPEIDPLTPLPNLTVDQINMLDTTRNAVAADGVSKVILKVTFPASGTIEFPQGSEGIQLPWGVITHNLNGEHVAYLLFTPPETFDSGLNPVYLYQDSVKAYDKVVAIDLLDANSEKHSFSLPIPVVAPPVVLVHGTYSRPDSAWLRQAPVPGGKSFVRRLTDDGFAVFIVDYSSSNGLSDPSSFAYNARVVWDNPGGIKESLQTFRHHLKCATTQADLIGHSLGGVLPRVYASEAYNPEGYLLSDNYFSGDINRLITISGTHFGSHLAEFQTFLEDLSPFDLGTLDWIALQAVEVLTTWVGGIPASEAVRDQIPPPAGEALLAIGRTGIPSHAITCSTPIGGLKDPVFDPHEEYFDLYWYIAFLLYQIEDIREIYLGSKSDLIDAGFLAETTLEGGDPDKLFPGYTNLMMFKTMIESAIKRSGQLMAILDGSFDLPSDIEIMHYVLSEVGMGDIADPLLTLYKANTDPAGLIEEYWNSFEPPSAGQLIEAYLTDYGPAMEGIRALIFNNDDNDGVVRVQSQSGELEKECPDCVSHFENVLHGFAPLYPEIQERVVNLLNGGMTNFNPDGFPPVDHPQPLYYPPVALELFKIPRTGPAAICQSGMVPSHANAIAKVADAQNVIIMFRPVNPDATELIQDHAATKVMNVKPKSSNWGPQKGYLPVNQRYSKLWKLFEGDERDDIIEQYNMKAQENLNDGIATMRHLSVSTCSGLYQVFIDSSQFTGIGDLSAENEVVLVPDADPQKICLWGDEFYPDMIVTDCFEKGKDNRLGPFYVMASPTIMDEEGNLRFITSDYDLLMVGFYEGPDQGAPDPPEVPFKDNVGQITDDQEVLAQWINEAVSSTGYKGGNVVHHGPENQFSHSPYIDYPITVFAPDEIPNGFFSGSTNGKILSIEMGPPGFRDLYLKQFINEMRKEGYDLYDNPEAPGWHWTWDAEVGGYLYEDSKDIVDYVAQLPLNNCDKYGVQIGAICPLVNRPVETGEKQDSWLLGNRSTGSLRIYPNPVTGGVLKVVLTEEFSGPVDWMILNAFGKVRAYGNTSQTQGLAPFNVGLGHLEPGIYTFSIPESSISIRFLKL